jgi:integrase
MPDADRHIPKYRHYKPKDLAVVRIDGHDHYLGQYDSPESREKYHRLLAERAARGSVTPAPKPGGRATAADVTVFELIRAYWRHVEKYYVKDGQPTTEVCVVRQALGVVGELYGHTLARDFGPLALEACQEAMVAKEWSRKSINRQTIRIRKMWKWAASREILPGSIYQDLQTVGGLVKGRNTPSGRIPKERRRVRSVPDDVVEKTLPHLPDVPASMVRLQRLTGMRPHEVCELRPIDIDMSDPTCWAYRPARHKTEHEDKDRDVFIGPRGQAVLRPFLGLEVMGYVFSPRRSEAGRNAKRHAARKTPLYRSHAAHQARKKAEKPRRTLRDHYSTNSYRQAIHRACDKAGVPRWNPHQIRHATASEIRSHFGLEGSRVVLGESDAATAAIYAEQDRQLARKIMQARG